MYIICFLAGFLTGSMAGVFLMCLLQVNRRNHEEKQQ